MTSEELYAAVEAAPERERDAVAERLLAQYDGYDKEEIKRTMGDFIAALSEEVVVI